MVSSSPTPIVSPGELGLFDDSGTSLGSVVNFNNQQHIYYIGWNLGVTVPWRNFIGLGRSTTNCHTFDKVGNTPVIERSPFDPFSVSYPHVINDSSGLRMWYGSNVKWGKKPDEMIHVIKHARSQNGVDWYRFNDVCLHPQIEKGEYAISRPCVVKEDDIYHMWFSYRRKNEDSYHLGYALSNNGVDWMRRDGLKFEGATESSWDSQMMCYPFVFRLGTDLFMLYNGNGFGATGFGLAKSLIT